MDPTPWFIHTVTVAPITGRSSSGDPTYGAQTTIKGRVLTGAKLVLNGPEGNVVEAQHVLVSGSKVNLSDRVWLPGDNTASTAAARRPLMVKNAPTKDGAYTLYQTFFA